jgi:hypothetical protein
VEGSLADCLSWYHRGFSWPIINQRVAVDKYAPRAPARPEFPLFQSRKRIVPVKMPKRALCQSRRRDEGGLGTDTHRHMQQIVSIHLRHDTSPTIHLCHCCNTRGSHRNWSSTNARPTVRRSPVFAFQMFFFLSKAQHPKQGGYAWHLRPGGRGGSVGHRVDGSIALSSQNNRKRDAKPLGGASLYYCISAKMSGV